MSLSHSAPAPPKTIIITDPGTSEYHKQTSVTTTDPIEAPTGTHLDVNQGSDTTLNFSNNAGSANTNVSLLRQSAGSVTNFGLQEMHVIVLL